MIDSKADAQDAEITSDDAAVATVKVKQENGVITDVVVTNVGAGLNRIGDAVGARVIAATNGTGALVGEDVATIKGYVDDKIADLDLPKTAADASVSDDNEFVTLTISETDGIVKLESLSIQHGTFGSYGGDGQVDGIAKISAVQTYVDNALTWTVIGNDNA